MPRPGRRPGNEDTKEQILDAARRQFARDGYRATIRAIAAEAEVDPALVMHYFGSKDRLYAASIEIPLDPTAIISSVQDGPPDQIGVRLARLFFTVWEQPAMRDPILAVLRGAMSGHHEGTAAFRDFLSTVLLPQVEAQVTHSHARLNTELAVAQLVGIAIMRYVMELEPIASAPIDEIIDLVGERVQSYFE